MQNKKMVGIGLGVGLAVLLLAAGLWLVIGKKEGKVSYGAASGNMSATKPEAATGLGVANSPGAKDLGQLNVGGQSGASNGGQGTQAGGSGGQGIDPSKFGEYDKYKDATSAMFGEVQAGNGKELGANQKATVVYKGWLTNGQVFDQSRTGSDGKLEAFSFTLGAGQVIRGWEEGLYGMKVGGTRMVIVPPAVGYGAQGQGGVPPNAVMIFVVQLVNVE